MENYTALQVAIFYFALLVLIVNFVFMVYFLFGYIQFKSRQEQARKKREAMENFFRKK